MPQTLPIPDRGAITSKLVKKDTDNPLNTARRLIREAIAESTSIFTVNITVTDEKSLI